MLMTPVGGFGGTSTKAEEILFMRRPYRNFEAKARNAFHLLPRSCLTDDKRMLSLVALANVRCATEGKPLGRCSLSSTEDIRMGLVAHRLFNDSSGRDTLELR